MPRFIPPGNHSPGPGSSDLKTMRKRIGRGTVLVVDDQESFRHIMTMALEEQGFVVLTAVDGIDAVQVFRRHAKDIDLVLLDLHMPRLSGDKALKEIRRVREGVPAILVSAVGNRSVVDQFVNKKGIDFLQKPFSLEEFFRRLSLLLRENDCGFEEGDELAMHGVITAVHDVSTRNGLFVFVTVLHAWPPFLTFNS